MVQEIVGAGMIDREDARGEGLRVQAGSRWVQRGETGDKFGNGLFHPRIEGAYTIGRQVDSVPLLDTRGQELS